MCKFWHFELHCFPTLHQVYPPPRLPDLGIPDPKHLLYGTSYSHIVPFLIKLTCRAHAAQQWTKKILKEFRLRHPEGNGDNNSAPATPASKAGASHAARTPKTPKTPASDKGQGKGKKRAKVEDDDDEGDSPFGSFVADPIAKTKTPRKSAKKVKHEMEEADEDEGVDVQPKSEERDDDYDFALDV